MGLSIPVSVAQHRAMFSLDSDGRRVELRHLRRGVFSVVLDGRSRQAKSAREAATIARDALGILEGAVDPVTVTVSGDGVSAQIWRPAGVAGFRLEVRRGEVGFTASAQTFEEVVETVLHSAPPWPESVKRQEAPLVIDGRFSFQEFADDPDPGPRAAELSALLSRYLNEAGSPYDSFLRAMDALRALGHDLWSWDTDDDESTWSWDYCTTRPGAGLTISASHSPFDPSTVQVDFKKRGA